MRLTHYWTVDFGIFVKYRVIASDLAEAIENATQVFKQVHPDQSNAIVKIEKGIEIWVKEN